MQRSTITPRRRIAALASLPLLALGLAACSGDDVPPVAPPTADGGTQTDPGEDSTTDDATDDATDGGSDISGQGGTWDGSEMSVEEFDLGEGAPGVFTGDAGECMAVTDTDMIVVSCDDPHDYEIFYTFNIEADTYPGVDAIEDEAIRACEEFFEAYVGIPLADSELLGDMLYPSEDTWAGAGDSEVICVAGSGSAMEGSIYGTGQ